MTAIYHACKSTSLLITITNLSKRNKVNLTTSVDEKNFGYITIKLLLQVMMEAVCKKNILLINSVDKLVKCIY